MVATLLGIAISVRALLRATSESQSNPMALIRIREQIVTTQRRSLPSIVIEIYEILADSNGKRP